MNLGKITIDAVLLGGGRGARFSQDEITTQPKQFQLVGELPIFIHALQALLSLDCLRQIVLAFPAAHLGLAEEQLDRYLPAQAHTLLRLVEGGERRQDSSAKALAALEEISPPPTRVLIHDACRPFLSAALQVEIKKAILDRSYGAWVPVVPVIETLKKIDGSQVTETVDRQKIFRAQTPQIFEFSVLRTVFQKARELDLDFTDDASLCEHFGIPVGAFPGDVRNLKLTYDFEREAVQSLLRAPAIPEETKPCTPESDSTFTA